MPCGKVTVFLVLKVWWREKIPCPNSCAATRAAPSALTLFKNKKPHYPLMGM